MEENEEMEKEGGNEERMRKCRKSITLHFLLISSFSLHFPTARMPGCHNLCNPGVNIASVYIRLIVFCALLFACFCHFAKQVVALIRHAQPMCIIFLPFLILIFFFSIHEYLISIIHTFSERPGQGADAAAGGGTLRDSACEVRRSTFGQAEDFFLMHLA